jgi:predicted ferric reductase
VHMYWYMGRSSGFVAYWLLFASVAMGLAVSSRVFDGVLTRPWVYEVHRFLSVFVLVAMFFHALIMLPDPYAKFTPAELLIPFKSHYKDTPMAIGIVTMYSSMLITLSFWAKRLIGQNGWRTLHYATFALFVAAMVHGMWIGTDSKQQIVQFSYLASGSMVLFLTLFRILAARSVARPRRIDTASSRANAA